jgi:hypothetical protein
LPNVSPRSNEGFQPVEVLSGLCEIRAAESESAGLAREIRSHREAESLASWADARGALWIKAAAPVTDELTGGEHLVEIDERALIVFKTTHPGKFGFGVDVEMIRPKGWKAKPRITVGLADATPEEYLFRLQQQNELFGDDIRVMGVAKFPQGFSVITTQPFYEGTRTDQNRINDWFAACGWKLIADKDGSFYEAEKDLLIMDALPRNVLTFPDGTVMPFDVVVVRPTGDLKWKLGL